MTLLAVAETRPIMLEISEMKLETIDAAARHIPDPTWPANTPVACPAVWADPMIPLIAFVRLISDRRYRPDRPEGLTDHHALVIQVLRHVTVVTR